MNARQKAKYWKKRYQELANTPIPKPIVIQHHIDTLQIDRVYPEALVNNRAKEAICETMKLDLAEGIAEQMDKYIDYRTEFLPHRNMYKFSASMQVVCKP